MELVSAALFKLYARLFGDVEDDTIVLLLDAATEMAEAYTRRDFVTKIKTKTFNIDQVPGILSANILGVEGYYTTIAEVEDAYNYYVNYVKGIIVSRELPLDCVNLPTYTIRYVVTVDPTDVPASVKIAIAKIAADLYENRENSSTSGNKELSINFKSLLAPYRKITLA